MLQGFKPVTMDALLLECTDQSLHHPVLLGAVRGDELLPWTIAANQLGIAAAGEDQAIVRSKQERFWNVTQRAESMNERLLESGFSRLGFAASGEVPA